MTIDSIEISDWRRDAPPFKLRFIRGRVRFQTGLFRGTERIQTGVRTVLSMGTCSTQWNHNAQLGWILVGATFQNLD